MDLFDRKLESLSHDIRERVELGFKRDVQSVARHFGQEKVVPWLAHQPTVKNGDDAAAIRQADGSYLLIATDGMRAEFVRHDPWFAGYSAVMVNISDVAAMGGRPQAIVDVLYLGSGGSERVMEGMEAASSAFGVPIVGGHTCRSAGPTLVSCAIVGSAQNLIESDTAQPGDELLFAVDLRGVFRSPIAFNAATTQGHAELRRQVALLSELADEGLVTAGKDVSNAGLLGTILMLLESSGVGAQIDLASVPAPPNVEPERWLMAFPSYGYVLTAPAAHVPQIRAKFVAQGITCERIGTVTRSPQFELCYGAHSDLFADTREPFTGFGSSLRTIAS